MLRNQKNFPFNQCNEWRTRAGVYRDCGSHIGVYLTPLWSFWCKKGVITPDILAGNGQTMWVFSKKHTTFYFYDGSPFMTYIGKYTPPPSPPATP